MVSHNLNRANLVQVRNLIRNPATKPCHTLKISYMATTLKQWIQLPHTHLSNPCLSVPLIIRNDVRRFLKQEMPS